MGNLSKQIITLPKIQLVGLTVRTNNATEMNPKTSKLLRSHRNISLSSSQTQSNTV